MDNSIRQLYNRERDLCREEISRLAGILNRYSVLRLLTAGLGIFAFYHSLRFDQFFVPVAVVFTTIFIFSLVVRAQTRVGVRSAYVKDLERVYTNELEGPGKLYDDGSKYADDGHPYTSDLDIFGQHSLFHLLNRCSTLEGNDLLASWLNKHADREEIAGRQSGVEELFVKQGWMASYQANLLFAATAKDEPARLLSYLRGTAKRMNKLMVRYIRVIPYVMLFSVLAGFFYSPFYLIAIVLVIINMLINQSFQLEIMKAEAAVSKVGRTLNKFSNALTAIQTESWKSGICSDLALAVKEEGQGKLPAQLRQLSRLIDHLDFGMTAAGAILNILILWNARQLLALQKWRRENYSNISGAFSIIAGFEALVSLARLKLNEPGWAFPVISAERFQLSAGGIGHPLIPAATRVNNDYALDRRGIDIITGSNMAGKSTFLRTLGINAVLAFAGAPVCAARMEVAPVQLFSYMRIRDSLQEYTSTFKAELDRLGALLQTLESDPDVFFLIDEMLRGTNSRDKYLGSKAVIEKLIAKQSVGLIATHDLQISELEQKYPQYVRNFYFDINIVGDEMQFDYKLKAGACRTFNAGLLLKRLGIDPSAD